MKRALADILWEAANVHLHESYNFGWRGFSCCAVASAIGVEEGCFEDAEDTRAMHFLQDLGCNVDAHSNVLTRDFDGADLQGVRYMWLLLAMHVAEDEGIEIEVER